MFPQVASRQKTPQARSGLNLCAKLQLCIPGRCRAACNTGSLGLSFPAQAFPTTACCSLPRMGLAETAAPASSLETGLTRLKKVVYKNRIRVKEFFTDFDKLRSGFVHPNHFLTALNMCGLNQHLSPQELQVICDAYTVPRSPSLIQTDYKTFLNDVEIVFTLPNLEKTPLADVAGEPIELLDKTRYDFSSRQIPAAEEALLQAVMQRLMDIVAKRGTPVKPFFDDAAEDDHSAKLYGHVTIPQFRQCMSTKLELQITEAEAQVIVKKYGNEEKPEFVNYIAFSNTVDPPEKYRSQF